MMFPRWHGTDKEGILFLEYFKKLKIDGMFENSNTAKEFLNYYLSFTWTETGKYEIVEVFKKIE
jgi:hypothetical protein